MQMTDPAEAWIAFLRIIEGSNHSVIARGYVQPTRNHSVTADAVDGGYEGICDKCGMTSGVQPTRNLAVTTVSKTRCNGSTRRN